MGFHDDSDEGFAEEASSGYRKRKASREAEAEEDDYEEEEEEEEEEDREARRRTGVSMFVDDYAGVDEGEESEEDEEEYEGDDLIADAQEDLPVEDHHTQRLYRPMHEDADEDPDALEQFINQRYESQYNQSDAPVVTQQSLLPTLRDPKLWVVQCRHGTERMLCIQLLGKYFAPNRGTSLMIKSAVCLDHLKGYFYVEAEKEAYVREAVKGLNNVFMSKGVKLVPLAEMVDAITVNKNAKLALEKGNWVRIRTGPYGGDLAKVANVDLANQKVTVKLIPRIDFSDMANQEEGRGRRGSTFGHGQKVRPAAKPFNKVVAESLGLSLVRRRIDGVSNYFLGKLRFVHGYLVKTLALRSIVAQETVPPLEELQKFNAAGQVNGEEADEDLESMLDALPEGKHGLRKGDEVVVTKGELKRLTGKVTEIKEDNKVRVQLNHADLVDSLVFDAGELTKHFQVGDHVRVDGGVHEGEVGMVIKVEGTMCLVMSDTTKKELRVFARDLCKAEQLDVGLDKIGDYELHDLVELDNNNYGVIVFVSKDFCKVLMADGSPDKPEVRIAGLVDIRSKVNARRNSTTDRFSNRVKTDDMIDIVHGPLKGTSGTIVYIIKGFLFIKCQDMVVNLGFIAVSSRFCCVRGGKNLPTRASDMQSLRTPVIGSATPGSFKSPGPSHLQSPKIDAFDRTPGWQGLASPRHPTMSNGHSSGGRGSGFKGGSEWRNGGFRGGRGGRGSNLLHKTVKIIKGPNRGYKGRVNDETPMHVRVELEANCKVVTVPKENVDAGDEGEFQERRRTRARNEPPSTPWHTTPKTPMHTPAHSWNSAPQLPTMTPLHPAMTPIHNNSGFQTFSGGQTPTAVKDDTDDANNPWLQSGPTTPAHTPLRPSASEANVTSTSGETPATAAQTWTKSEQKGIEESESVGGQGNNDGEMGSSQLGGLTVEGQNGSVKELSNQELESAWQGVFVELSDDRKGLVTSVGSDGICEVNVLVADEAAPSGYRESLDTDSVDAKNLIRAKAQKHDRIRVLSGDDKGSTGSVVGIDGTDGIVKLDESRGIKILEIACLGCILPTSDSVKTEG